ncbi:MAG: hypothetical protein OSA51_03755 [Octadecabacter sp.]|nr:hypothetical protein [Octadecabacter sp.]
MLSLDGTEVTTRATIGYSSRGSGLIINPEEMSGGVRARVALSRDQLAKIEGCDARDYETRCTADILAELTFSDGVILATVFDVQNVVRGEHP